MNSCKISAQNIVQKILEPFPAAVNTLRAVSEPRTVSELRAVSALMVVSALLAAYACVLRLTAETCAIVIAAKVAAVFNIMIGSFRIN